MSCIHVHKRRVALEPEEGDYCPIEAQYEYPSTRRNNPNEMAYDDVVNLVQHEPKALFFPNSLSQFTGDVRRRLILEAMALTPPEDTMQWFEFKAPEFFLDRRVLPKDAVSFLRLVWSRIKTQEARSAVTRHVLPFVKTEMKFLCAFVKINPRFVWEMDEAQIRPRAKHEAWKTALRQDCRVIYKLSDTLKTDMRLDIMAEYQRLRYSPCCAALYYQLEEEENEILRVTLRALRAFNLRGRLLEPAEELIVRGYLGLSFNEWAAPPGYKRWDMFTLGRTLGWQKKTSKKRKY